MLRFPTRQGKNEAQRFFAIKSKHAILFEEIYKDLVIALKGI